jgi:hypothetical protein
LALGPSSALGLGATSRRSSRSEVCQVPRAMCHAPPPPLVQALNGRPRHRPAMSSHRKGEPELVFGYWLGAK